MARFLSVKIIIASMTCVFVSEYFKSIITKQLGYQGKIIPGHACVVFADISVDGQDIPQAISMIASDIHESQPEVQFFDLEKKVQGLNQTPVSTLTILVFFRVLLSHLTAGLYSNFITKLLCVIC